MFTFEWWVENYFMPLSVALSAELIILMALKYQKKYAYPELLGVKVYTY